MKKLFLFFTLIVTSMVSVFSENFPTDFQGLPFYEYSEEAIGNDLVSPVTGKIISEETIAEKTTVVIMTMTEYYYNGKAENVSYEIVISDIAEYIKQDEISSGAKLGATTKSSKIVARNKTLDNFLVRLTSAPPIIYDTYYYFAPAWLIPTKTNYLSFRQVDSFENAVLDFYNRWFNEEEEKLQTGSTIHYFPDLDRIRVKISLPELPKDAIRISGLELTEKSYYRSGIFKYENEIATKCVYTPVLYWQDGFLEYLKNEYTLGTEMYIYCSIYTLDHNTKKIIVCVRDFSLESDEEIIQTRIADLK